MTDTEKAILEETLDSTIGHNEEIIKLAEELELEVVSTVKVSE
jgi:hypothetical protein